MVFPDPSVEEEKFAAVHSLHFASDGASSVVRSVSLATVLSHAALLHTGTSGIPQFFHGMSVTTVVA
ncbi:MAG: hypothetical protein WAW59_01015 [Patescibacteria group bacterium]